MDNGNWDVSLMDTARMLARLGSEPALDFVAVWVPNSTELIYQSTNAGVLVLISNWRPRR